MKSDWHGVLVPKCHTFLIYDAINDAINAAFRTSVARLFAFLNAHPHKLHQRRFHIQSLEHVASAKYLSLIAALETRYTLEIATSFTLQCVCWRARSPPEGAVLVTALRTPAGQKRGADRGGEEGGGREDDILDVPTAGVGDVSER